MSFDFSAYPRIDIPEGRVKQIARASDGLVLWTAGYINQVPLSIDTDGSIYNGKGFMEGYRLSSSGVLKEQNNSAVCGYIPAKTGDIVRLAGMDWSNKDNSIYDYIVTYNSSFELQSTYNSQGYGSGATVSQEENGITTFIITKEDIAYIRISATGSGADMVVAVNEDIT